MSNYLEEAKQVGEVFSSPIMTFDQPYNYCTKIKEAINSGHINYVVYFDKYAGCNIRSWINKNPIVKVGKNINAKSQSSEMLSK